MNRMNIHSQKSGRSRRVYAQPSEPVNNVSAAPHAPIGFSAQQPKKPRIDPNLIPSPVEQRMQSANDPQCFYTCSNDPLPCVLTEFQCVDQGNCNPRFIRPTLREAPEESGFLTDTSLPFGLIVQPLAQTDLPLVDSGSQGPVRCHRCKGYLNPWCRYTDLGKKYVCNLCDYENPVSEDQFCPLDSVGRRMDMESHPELTYGSVDFRVSEEYWLGSEPQPLHYLFVMDVSSGAELKPLCKAIWDLIYSDAFPSNTKIGILTFDSCLHFYDLQPTQASPTMTVMPDIEDVFVPMSGNLFVNPKESRPLISQLLNKIPAMFQTNRTSSAFGSAVKAIQLVMKECGGKVLLTQTSLPSIGPGVLKNRDDPKLYACEQEKSLFSPQMEYYTQVGNALADSGVSVDLWLLPGTKAYIDVATLGVLSALTGGDTHYFPQADESQQEQIYQLVKQSIQREHGYRATSRIRCSNGISLSNYYGNFSMKNATDVDLAGVHKDTTIGIELKHDGGRLYENAYFQYAMLYTTATGERRLRLHNLRVGVAKTVAALFKGADVDATACLLVKRFVTLSAKKSLSDINSELDQLCVQILLGYRKFVTPQASSAQLVLPETVKTLPLLISSFKKSLALRKDVSIGPDVRVDILRKLKSANVQKIALWLYPQMVKVHELFDQKTNVLLERLSYSRLETNGIYWIENYDSIYLWLGKGVSPDLLERIFGTYDLTELKHMKEIAATKGSTENNPLWSLYYAKDSLLKFHIIRQGLDMETQFSSVMVEDEAFSQMSYPDYLCEIHRLIKQELDRETQHAAISSASYWAYRY
ncbi:Sec23/Sec24 trunk domain-containing protein [Sporodiniella umbellata]|nr:Sec23/Sec24 trunk domain-containing protein [Sporodiniella umbellata]